MTTTNSQQLEDRLVDFASLILDLIETLPQMITAKTMAHQLARSGTAPALNYGEARGAESRVDFIHKTKICLKELRETFINLKIIKKQKWIKEDLLIPILDECNQLISIFVATHKTMSQKS